mmetsp:Transcript_23754/g.34642  ORF Transcript_23754/g.34642 Transcript_23754/m.34642 type:complete len:129 (+) Transcript_23754:75-461(+)|eukprot:CAMPEP_0195517180 /NCGR_PEP_ID=MMETSP0794_2-20130614/10226_1 /TAXON_ID=515487 /ORGANISM="Stephanopyxis turris, Strain CCMP 815" /LENGTH=128 /DNA_ID=CAMNT_0040645949 /DNA_START=75 /DNA_END=461 /DNA_ORIENTATION=-
MGWFGGGSSDSQPETKDFSSLDESASFPSESPNYASSPVGGGGGGAAAEIQQFGQALQQQVLVQQVVTNLTQTAFENCVSRPSDSLAGKEVSCIHATVGKWMDTNEFMMGRMRKKMQQQGGGGGSNFS